MINLSPISSTEINYPQNTRVFLSSTWLKIVSDENTYVVHGSHRKLGDIFIPVQKKQKYGITYFGNLNNTRYLYIHSSRKSVVELNYYPDEITDIFRVAFRRKLYQFQFSPEIQNARFIDSIARMFHMRSTNILLYRDYIHQGINLFSGSLRRELKKAKDRYELIVTDKVSTDDAMLILNDTYHRQNRRNPFEKNFIDYLLSHRSSFIASGVLNSSRKLVAFNVCGYDFRASHYLLGGTSNEYRNTGAGSLALSESIRRSFDETNCELFDLYGSDKQEIFRYFTNFRPHLMNFYRVRGFRCT